MEQKFHSSLSEIFQKSWEVYKENLGRFLVIILIGMGISVILVVPLILIAMLLIFGGLISVTNNYAGLLSNPWFWGAIVIGIFDLVLLIAWGYLYYLAMVATVNSRIEGKKMDYKQAFGVAFKKFWSVIWASILTGLVIGLGFIFLIIPGLILAVFLQFVVYAVLFENKKGIGALSTSWQYVSGHFWWVVGVLIVTYLLNIALSSVPYIGGILQLLYFPFMTAVTLLLYKELKKIKE